MKRVLMIADGAWATGFERVARGIGAYLQGTGQFEVVHRALGYGPGAKNRVAPYPYELKPTRQTGEDPLAVTQVPLWLAEDKPDVVLMIQDIWNQTNYLGYMPRDLPTVGYYPIDTPNLKWSYAMGAAALTDAVPYTAFGARETAIGVRDLVDVVLGAHERQGVDLSQAAAWMTVPRDSMELHLRVDRLAARQNPSAYAPVPHGIDHAKFYPSDKGEARRQWGFPDDAFIVLNVNTNQFRKRQDITIRAFARLAAAEPKALLVLHCMGGNDKDGWDLAQLARLYGVQDKVICTHFSYPNLSDEQLRLLYNTADVQVNTGGGEGWGLCSSEGALCGVPQLVPDWSATREIWQGAGGLLPVLDYRFEPKYLNTAHAILDVQGVSDMLVTFAQDRERLAHCGVLCRERASSHPTWDEVGARFAERIEQTYVRASLPAEPVSLQALRSMREGDLVSELI
jgi:glycosyltransferase involved in cell wall biosynthesis